MAQFRVDIPEELRDELQAALDDQASSYKDGVTRIFRWFVSLDKDMRAAVLGQLSHSGANLVAKWIVERESKK